MWSLILGGGAGLAIAVFVSRRLVEQALTVHLERYRAELAQRTDALKTELSIYAHEQTIALSRVDAQRARAISDMFVALRGWVNPAAELANGTPVVDADHGEQWRYARDRAEKAHEAGKELSRVLADSAIYIDAATYEKLATVVQASTRATAAFLRHIREAEANGLEEESAPGVEEERRHFAVLFQRKITPLHQEIVTEFRQLLDVERSRDVA